MAMATLLATCTLWSGGRWRSRRQKRDTEGWRQRGGLHPAGARRHDCAAVKEVAKGDPLVLVVLRGWPGYQCPFCTRQFGDYLANAARFEEVRARVLFIYRSG
jgi:hypothetical protein